MNINELIDIQRRYPQYELRAVWRLARMALCDRVKIDGWWEIVDNNGVNYGGRFGAKEVAERFKADVGILLEDARIVHVTRYRSRANG